MRSTKRPDKPAEEYRTLFESMTDGFAFHEIITDESGKPCDYRFLDINPAFERQTGLKRADVIGRRALEVMPDLEPFWIETYGRVGLTGEAAHFENFSASLNRWYQVYAYRPAPLRFATVFSDITERKREEEALREAKKDLEVREQAEAAELESAVRALRTEIAERVQVENALVAERQRFTGVLETLPAYLVLLDPDYRVPFANRFFRERFGESHGRRCFEYLFQRTDPCPNCETYKVLKTNAPHHWEWLGPDGRNYDIFDFPFRDSDGSPLIMEMGIDVTEQKKAEAVLKDLNETLERRVAERTAALRESEENYRRIVETAQEGITVGSPEGRFVFANRRMAELLGYEPDEVVGRMGLDFMDEDEREKVLQSRAELKKGHIIHREYKFRRKDGSTIWTYCSASPLYDGDGRYVGNLAMHSDVTERKNAEERAGHLASFPEMNPNPVIEIGPSGEVMYSNPATPKILEGLGRGAAEISVFLPPDMPDLLAELEGKKESSFYREVGIGGRVFGERIHIISQFNVARVYAFDITDRKRAEEELKRSNENLEQYAYVASHDLQEPLRILASYSQLLAKRYKDKLDQDADDFIGFITDAASRMQRLISDLLAYSRIGRKDLSLAEVDCDAVVRSAIDGLAARIESCGGQVAVAPLPVVRAHETSLTQLFQNLIGNALKFRGEDPPRIEVGAARRGREWIFSVQDNGIGIEPQYRERIFMIFQRLHTQDAYPGTGIGLAICKKIVENHGGRIWCESKPGRGSTFYFSLPTGESSHE